MRVTKRLIEEWRVQYGLYKISPEEAAISWKRHYGDGNHNLIYYLGHSLNEIERLRAEIRRLKKKS